MRLARRLTAAFAVTAAVATTALASPLKGSEDAQGGALLPSLEEYSDCAPAASSQYLQLCNRFTTEPGTIRCIAAGRDRYFAACALTLCMRFTTEDGAVQCLEASRDKAYTSEEMTLCDRFTTEDGAVGCLQAGGRPTRPGDDVDLYLRRVRRDLLDVSDDIRAGRTARALDLLEGVIRDLDQRTRP